SKCLDHDKEQAQLFAYMTAPSRPVYQMNGYGKEALDIVVDYLDQLGANHVAVGRPTNGVVEGPISQYFGICTLSKPVVQARDNFWATLARAAGLNQI